MQFGRYYEEFEVGAVYKHWPGKTVTEYDDHLFCLLTMNHHPLHMDVNYAEKTTDFGKNVVVGNYIYSLLLGMSVPDVSGKAIANLEVESLRHVAPTFHGDTIYGETTVLDKTESKSKDDRGIVYVETIGYKQDGTIVCIFRRKVMVPKRSYGESPRRRAAGPSGADSALTAGRARDRISRASTPQPRSVSTQPRRAGQPVERGGVDEQRRRRRRRPATGYWSGRVDQRAARSRRRRTRRRPAGIAPARPARRPGHVQPGLLAHLPDDGLLRRLARLDPAARAGTTARGAGRGRAGSAAGGRRRRARPRRRRARPRRRGDRRRSSAPVGSHARQATQPAPRPRRASATSSTGCAPLDDSVRSQDGVTR